MNWKMPQFPALKGDKRTDVLIIGGGLCGVLCAWFLDRAGVDYILVEGDVIGGGTTGNTTAKVTSQHNLIYDKMIRWAGQERAQQYLDANEQALARYREMARHMEFEFEEKDAWVYTLSDREKIEREVEAVNRLGFPAVFEEQTALPFQTKGAVRFPGQAQLHPLKFLAAVSQGLNIYEHTFVKELAPHTAYYGQRHAAGDESQDEDSGVITAQQMIVATHFPFLNKHGGYFLKLYQSRSYVIALENAPDVGGMYLDEAENGLSFRNAQGLLLLGGAGHRTGKPGGAWQELRRAAGVYYPKAQERYAWAAQDCMSLDGIPYIGQYSRNTPGLYTATGFHKWGMTSSMAAASVLFGLVTGRGSEYEKLFAPGRSMRKPQLLVNGWEAAVGLLTPARPRCPHLGCALKWNPQEHSWDCACHGSRFEAGGRLIDNPSTGDLPGKTKLPAGTR